MNRPGRLEAGVGRSPERGRGSALETTAARVCWLYESVRAALRGVDERRD